MAFDLSRLGQLNSMTKYPSILTYHKIDGKSGKLDPDAWEVVFEDDETVFVTQKINGTNGRIILLADADGQSYDYFIGTREEIVYAKGDRVVNPEMHIAPNLVELANTITQSRLTTLGLYHCFVLFGEVYGRDIERGKNYGKAYGFRLFDVAAFTTNQFNELLAMPRDRISMWRQHGGTPFVNIDGMKGAADRLGIETVPYVAEVQGDEFPVGLTETHGWLKRVLPHNLAMTDNTGTGAVEGVVVRTSDRSKIAKIRHEDYERTFRMRNK